MSAEGVAEQGQETSVRDDLVAAFATLKAREAESAPLTDAQPAKPEVAQDQNAGQTRDGRGQFAKPDAAVEGAAGQDQGESAAAAAAQAAKPVAKAPDGWNAEMKAVFGTLDPKVQAEIARRETELTRKITSVDEERTFGKKMKEAAQPYQAIMAAEGATVDQAFGSFLNYNFIMRQGTPQQKVQAILDVVRIFNVPLQEAIQQPQSNVVRHPAIESLEQRLNRIEQQRQAEENQRQQQIDAESQQEIEAFGTDPSHPNFETVKAHMGTLLTNGLAKSLQDAYDQACYARPEIRSTLMAAQVASEQEKLIQKAETAKKAAGSVVGGPGGARPQATATQTSGSIRDDIKAAIAQVNSGRV